MDNRKLVQSRERDGNHLQPPFRRHLLAFGTKTRRISNLLTLTQNHRETWSELLHNESLARVLERSANLEKHPITLNERLFVTMVVQHLGSAYEAIKTGLVIKPEGMKQDVGRFFSMPIPRAIWAKIKPLQNDDFIGFVEKCLEAQ